MFDNETPPRVRPIYSVHVTSTLEDGSKRTICVLRTMDRDQADRVREQYGTQGSVRKM